MTTAVVLRDVGGWTIRGTRYGNRLGLPLQSNNGSFLGTSYADQSDSALGDFMFPVSIVGRIEVPKLDAERAAAILRRIETALASEKAVDIVRNGNAVSFRGGMLRLVWNWNLLIPVSYGVIEVAAGDPGLVRYDFSCRRMLFVVSVMICLLGAMLVRGPMPAGELLGIMGFGWLWLFGMNYCIGALRLPRFVRRAAGG